MSPNPRREKGLSQRAKGEEFSLGTFRTIGSLEIKETYFVNVFSIYYQHLLKLVALELQTTNRGNIFFTS